MKGRFIPGIIYIFGGFLLIFGPLSLFKICSTAEMVMKCHWSAQAEIGIGILALLAGVLTFFARLRESRLLVNVLSLGIYATAILIPAVLIGGCGSKEMPCRTLTFPAIYLITVFIILFILFDSFLLIRLRNTALQTPGDGDKQGA